MQWRRKPIESLPIAGAPAAADCYMMGCMTDLLADQPLTPAPAAAHLAGLNEAQCRAVEAVEGAVLVLAGAGTGKTRVLTTRLAHILATGRAYPGEVLAVTFTNKAAREMRERLEGMIGRAADGVWLGTFHALGRPHPAPPCRGGRAAARTSRSSTATTSSAS